MIELIFRALVWFVEFQVRQQMAVAKLHQRVYGVM